MKLIKRIIQFFKSILEKRRLKKLTKIVQKGATKKNNERKKLDFLVAIYIQKFLKRSKSNSSEFIPLDYKTKNKLAENVNAEFGEQMAQLNLKYHKHKMELV